MNREALVAALTRMAGCDRLLVYDLTEDEAPQRADPSSPYVQGSPAWWRFVERRRRLDDGQNLSLIISLRGLRADERLTIVNWGTAFANAFLLIEPSDPWLDLTTAQAIDDAAAKAGVADAVALARASYADWVYWVRDAEGILESRSATLDLSNPKTTLWQAVWERLPLAFPADTFLSSLTLLNLRETELFTGGRQVARAIVPFLTRLGLPIVWDARHVIEGVRQLVNAGLAWVQDPQDNNRVYRGPAKPIPADITDERLAVMLR